MIQTRRHFLSGLAGGGLTVVLVDRRLAASPRQESAPGIRATLDRLLPPLLSTQNVPGAQVAVLERYRVAWSAGYGLADNASKAPVLSSTRFEGASFSKPLFSALVLQLAAEGVITLDRPLVQYDARPYVADDPRMGQLTARHVLTHVTGWPNWRRGKPLAFTANPGARYGYSGEGFFYLQRVVEKVTGQALEGLMRARVLDPLGLEHTSYEWVDALADKVASGHDARGAPVARLARRGPQGAEAEPESTSPNAASSVYTTAADFARFLAAVIDPEPSPIIAEGSKRAMCDAAVRVDQDLARSVGWGVQRHDGRGAIFHNGNNYFVQNFAIGFPADGSGLVCMTNGVKGKAVYAAVIAAAAGGAMPAVDRS